MSVGGRRSPEGGRQSRHPRRLLPQGGHGPNPLRSQEETRLTPLPPVPSPGHTHPEAQKPSGRRPQRSPPSPGRGDRGSPGTPAPPHRRTVRRPCHRVRTAPGRLSRAPGPLPTWRGGPEPRAPSPPSRPQGLRGHVRVRPGTEPPGAAQQQWEPGRRWRVTLGLGLLLQPARCLEHAHCPHSGLEVSPTCPAVLSSFPHTACP